MNVPLTTTKITLTWIVGNNLCQSLNFPSLVSCLIEVFITIHVNLGPQCLSNNDKLFM